MKKKRDLENTLFSFLDVISCGFGAIVMLVLIYKFNPSENIENYDEDNENYILKINELQEINDQLKKTKEQLNNKVVEINKKFLEVKNSIQNKQNSLTSIEEKKKNLKDSAEALKLVEDNLKSFSLKKKKKIIRDIEVGGIPVDSDYVIFIVDTSGSMLTIWDKVSSKIENILKIHPNVKGFQILNDMGVPLISGYKNKWIPDTPTWRKNSLKLFKMWVIASNSSPLEGIEWALIKYSDPKKSVAIYVMGDDYTGGDYNTAINKITNLNKKKKFKTRIHAIGFLAQDTTDRFSIIMREITKQNNGTFIALPR